MKIRLILLSFPLVLVLALVGCKKKTDDATAPARTGTKSTAASKAVGEPADLSVKWPVGGRFLQRMDVVQNSETTVPGMPQAVKQSTTMGQDMTLNVLKEVGAGGRQVEMSFAGIDMSVFQGDREVMAFDSKGESLDEDRNPMAAMFRVMVGAKLLLTIDASNNVEKVEGWSELVDAMSGAMKGPGKNMLGSMFSEDYFKQMGNFGSGMPGRTMKPGEGWPWKTEITMGPMGKVTVDLTYTFAGWEERNNRKLAVIESVGTVNAKGEPGAGPMGASINIDDGKWTGKSWFDPERSLVVETVVDQKMNMRMNMPQRPNPGTPSPPGGMTLTNVMTQKVTFKVAPEGP